MTPLFSVIVPTYGRARHLSAALKSILLQTVADFEVVVVDDCSPSPVIVPPDERVRLIRRETNGGPAAARNTGIRAARGRYLVFCDDDDLMTPERLDVACEGLRRSPLAFCFRRATDGTSGGNRVLEGRVYDHLLDGMTPHLGQVAVRTDLAVEFDERFRGLEDVDWLLRVTRTVAAATVSRTGYIYRIHDGVRKTHGVEARLRGSELLMRKHEAYFRTHRRAAAFRWKRIALMSLERDGAAARSALLRSLAIRPSPSALAHLARTFMPFTSSPRATSHKRS